MKRSGSCHCGAVRFEVELADDARAGRCNCSVCTKTGVTGLITKPANFTLVDGESSLTSYRWGAGISTRYFCKACGVHCFGKGHLAEVGGDFVSINASTLDGFDVAKEKLMYWDGRHDNWQAGPSDTPYPIG